MYHFYAIFNLENESRNNQQLEISLSWKWDYIIRNSNIPFCKLVSVF